MNPLRILGASANVFFLAFMTGFLAKSSILGTAFSPFVTFVGCVLLYGIAIASLIVLFEGMAGKLFPYAMVGSAIALIVFSYMSVTHSVPAAEQGIALLAVWAAANTLSLGFGNNLAALSIRENRRRAAQKRRLELLRTKNPNEPETKA
jgi:hypothetical protein